MVQSFNGSRKIKGKTLDVRRLEIQNNFFGLWTGKDYIYANGLDETKI
jgi:hypothetical protein